VNRLTLSALAFALLAGCGHTVDITSRSTGETGHTSVPPFVHQGQLSIILNGKNYTGPWVYLPQGGGVSLTSGFVSSGFRTASLTSTGLILPSGGNGQVLLHATDGSRIRCLFTFSEWSSTGMGECEDNNGEMYDVQIGR
jgi:hypothetical protein